MNENPKDPYSYGKPKDGDYYPENCTTHDELLNTTINKQPKKPIKEPTIYLILACIAILFLICVLVLNSCDPSNYPLPDVD